jgi:hypothetical protein
VKDADHVKEMAVLIGAASIGGAVGEWLRPSPVMCCAVIAIATTLFLKTLQRFRRAENEAAELRRKSR